MPLQDSVDDDGWSKLQEAHDAFSSMISAVNGQVRKLNASKPDRETARDLINKLDDKLVEVNQHLMSMTKLMTNAAGTTTNLIIKQTLTTAARDFDAFLKLSSELDSILKMYRVRPAITKKPSMKAEP